VGLTGERCGGGLDGHYLRSVAKRFNKRTARTTATPITVRCNHGLRAPLPQGIL